MKLAQLYFTAAVYAGQASVGVENPDIKGTAPFPITIPQRPSCEAIVADPDTKHPEPQSLPPEEIRITGADGAITTINVEIARSKGEQAEGLMHRTEMPEGSAGMLFPNVPVAEGENLQVWMKDTYIPLDIVFLDENGKIVKIERNALPCDETPIDGGKDAVSFLELPAGDADLYGLTEGQTVTYLEPPQTAPQQPRPIPMPGPGIIPA